MGARNVPDRDTTMIAPVAALVADHDLHPALVAVLAQAALDIHSQGTVLRARQHVDLVRAPRDAAASRRDAIARAGAGLSRTLVVSSDRKRAPRCRSARL
jgi:hypothetical protein